VVVDHQRLKGEATVKSVLNLLATFVVMVLLLFAVGLLGGVGTVELWLWIALLITSLVVVARRSRPGSSG
jgi:hypothetical protein